MLIAGDIGGTKTILGLYSRERGPRSPLFMEKFPSRDFTSFEELVKEFLAAVDVVPETAVFGIAGPVVGSQVALTNLPWVIEEKSVMKTLHITSVRLMNDLEATGYSIPLLTQEDLLTLHEGVRVPEGAVGIVAPGTGLGEAFVTFDGPRHRVHPSEGGHANFAPTSEREIGLLRYLLAEYGHVSYERVCSGQGLFNIYRYLRESEHADEPEWLAEALARAEDPAAVIVNAAVDSEKPCKLCSETLDMFVSILGAEAGNVALNVMATGGIYIGGGIPPRVIPFLKSPSFIEAFLNKGRFSHILEQLPVHVILNTEVVIMGAASCGMGVPESPFSGQTNND